MNQLTPSAYELWLPARYRPFRLLAWHAAYHQAPWYKTAQLLVCRSLSLSFVVNDMLLCTRRESSKQNNEWRFSWRVLEYINILNYLIIDQLPMSFRGILIMQWNDGCRLVITTLHVSRTVVLCSCMLAVCFFRIKKTIYRQKIWQYNFLMRFVTPRSTYVKHLHTPPHPTYSRWYDLEKFRVWKPTLILIHPLPLLLWTYSECN